MLDLERLLQQDEGQYFDRKSLWHGPPDARKKRSAREVRDQIAEYVAAFANADGGILLLGQEDEDRAVTGHGFDAEAVELLLRVPGDRLRPPLAQGIRLAWEGHELLAFEVQPAEAAVMVVGDGFPRRVGDSVILESEEAINAIKRRARAEGLELDLAEGRTLADLDLARIETALRGSGLTGITPEEYLIERRLADRRGAELVLRQGAVLLFAREARLIEHPNAGVRIFRVHGRERLTGDRHNVQEEPRIEGALPVVVERAQAVLRGLIQRSAKLHDLFFREMPEYPDFVWQEALVNAVAHRDYRVRGRSVEVWLFDDRMEVVSPGELPAEVPLESLLRREPIHCSRNPRITRVLAELGLMREQGEGILRMYEEMERSLLRLPEFASESGTFRVVLHNEPGFETPDQGWVRHVQALPVAPRQKRILVAFPRGEFSSSDYQRLNAVDRDSAYRELAELRELGLVKDASGKKGKGARYAVAARGSVGAPLGSTLSPRRVLDGRIQRQGFLRNSDYRDAYGVDRRAALQALSDLTQRRVLVREGERRGTRYLAGPSWAEWVEEEGPAIGS